MKILSWNILQGGGTRSAGIASAIAAHAADIVTLQEFRNGPAAAPILAALKNTGCRYVHIEETEASEHTILIASRFAFDAGPYMPEDVRPVPILEALFPAAQLGFELTLLPVHFPQKDPQVPLFKQLLEDTSVFAKGHTLLIGDLNCGIPFADSMTKTFFATDYLQTMLTTGWRDCWRSRNGDAREYTWISSVKKHGFRYDQALASKAFDETVTACYYDHEVREKGLSDHSALCVIL